MDHFNHIEPELAKRVAEGLGLPVPSPIPGWKNHGKISPALSMLNTAKGNYSLFLPFIVLFVFTFSARCGDKKGGYPRG